MMADIDQNDQRIALIKPDDPNIHIDTEFEKISGSLDAFCTQRRVHGILRKKPEFILKLLFFLV